MTTTAAPITQMTTTTPEELEREVSRLLAAGEHAAAAAALRFHGQPGRAGTLYESIFERRVALQCFDEAGDVVGAVRTAIALDDVDALERLVGEAIARGLGDILIGALTKAGRLREVGRVYLARGELLAAARAFADAGALSDAARCHEELGDAREAGLLLEAWLERHPEDDGAALRLGRILARFGRHDDAVTLLQRGLRTTADKDVVMCRAAPTLALAFVALGYDDAARQSVTSWQAAHARVLHRLPDDVARLALETPPKSLEELLQSARAAAFAAVQQTSPSSSSAGSSPPSSSPPKAVDMFESLLGGNNEVPEDAVSEAVDIDDGAAEQRLLLNGRYLLGEPLGGGGVGQVFRAYDAFSDRAVAVKIFGAQVLTSEAVSAWAREVRAAASLDHPAMVKLVELNMAQGFVVTELHGEGDGAVLLEDRLQHGSADAGWLVPTLVAVLDALAACHRTGLVHGGLKPRNVFVVQGGVKLLDTGAHRLLSLRATETGGLASVWPYLSPELLFGAPADVDGDLYAAAAIVYRALTGQVPFAAADADRRQAPLRADVVNPAVPAAWADFLATALSPLRSERFADAESMRRAVPPPPAMALPSARSIERTTSTQAPTVHGEQRYVKGALRERRGLLRTWEATDALVARPVWLIERDTRAAQDLDGDGLDDLAPFSTAARLWRGVQPIYDVLVDDDGRVRQVVLARDANGARANLDELRRVPQSLTRDLVAVAEALTTLHKEGLALGGFDVDRAVGPVGPRLRFAPAPPLVTATPATITADFVSFEGLVDAAFAADDDSSLDARGRLLAALHNGRFLERNDLEALAREREAPWPQFLSLVGEHLSRGAQSRTVARLVASIVRGTRD